MKIADRMDFIPFTPIRKVVEAAAKKEAAGETIIHMDLGRPDFDTPAHIKEAAARALSQGKVHYTSNYGIMELREAIAEKLQLENHINYDPDGEIIVTSGVAEGIFMCMMALLNPGDEVLIPTPAFPSYERCVYMAGAIPVKVPLNEEDGFTLNIEQLRDNVTDNTRMIVLNSPNNPTGTVLSFEEINELALFAVESDILVVSDEIYEKIIYDGKKHISIASLPGMRKRTITLNGFSKSHAMTGWRIGYTAADRNFTAALIRIRQYSTNCSNSFAQYGAVAALKGDTKCMDEMVFAFDRRRCMLIERLREFPGIFFTHPQGAFYILINVSHLSKTPQQIASFLLDEAGIAIVPWGEKHIRLSYANSYEKLEIAMDRMLNIFKHWA